jgi:hypothetical protein
MHIKTLHSPDRKFVSDRVYVPTASARLLDMNGLFIREPRHIRCLSCKAVTLPAKSP